MFQVDRINLLRYLSCSDGEKESSANDVLLQRAGSSKESQQTTQQPPMVLQQRQTNQKLISGVRIEPPNELTS